MNILAQDQDSEMSSEMAHYPDWSAADQYDSQSEGLAAKLEDVNQPSAKSGYKRKTEDSSEADSEDEEDGTQTHNDNGRRVRARSLIDDEQLAVLKGYYAINPRPKKEEIIMIANYINFPTRVVQVHIFPQKILQKRNLTRLTPCLMTLFKRMLVFHCFNTMFKFIHNNVQFEEVKLKLALKLKFVRNRIFICLNWNCYRKK